MGSASGIKNDVPGNIVHASDICISLTVDDYKSVSQVNLQSSATGIISYMNCVGVGIPFLTYNFKVNKHFLTRHNLKLGQVYTINSPSREILAEAIQEFGGQIKDVPLTSGGFAMDIARIAQLLLPQPKTVAFLGARATDEDAQTLKELCRQTRVGVRLVDVANCRTAVLLVAHYKRMWCEIFFIDNMATISPSFIDKPIVTQMLERANMVFITELSVLLNPKVTQMLAYYSFSRFKHCLFILHHEQFLLQTKEIVQEILSYVDIIFLTPRELDNVRLPPDPGVVNQMTDLLSVHDEHPVPRIYLQCCNSWRNAWDIYLWLKVLAKKLSLVIVSDGIHTAYVHTDLNTGMSARYKSKFARRTKAVNYYGATRAFVAGFMAMMIRGHQLDPCVECGFYCASVIVRKLGVQIPDDEEAMNEWLESVDNETRYGVRVLCDALHGRLAALRRERPSYMGLNSVQ